MKTNQKMLFTALLLVSMCCWSGCGNDDDGAVPAQLEKTYPLTAVDNSGVSGTVTFTKQDTQTTLVTIALNNTDAGNTHPAHIHMNNASEGGPIVVPLTSVDGATGLSETEVTALSDNTPVTYEELLAFDGHVNVHLSASEIATLISQGNIGANYTGGNNNNNNNGNNGNNGGNTGGY